MAVGMGAVAVGLELAAGMAVVEVGVELAAGMGGVAVGVELAAGTDGVAVGVELSVTIGVVPLEAVVPPPPQAPIMTATISNTSA